VIFVAEGSLLGLLIARTGLNQGGRAVCVGSAVVGLFGGREDVEEEKR
jgi:hypothetical protein